MTEPTRASRFRTRRQWWRTLLLVVLVLILPAPGDSADDNRLAWRLFNQQQYAQSAELFSDPAWKGVAMYRSGQWWRAAEAFVRANDADSLYNLGNSYVRLGYHALALDAYQATLAIEPDHQDARFNADLIRELLAARQDNKGQSALTPKAREIDRLEKDDPQPEKGQPSSTGKDEADQRTDSDRQRPDQTERSQDEQTGTSASSGGNNASRDTRREQSALSQDRLSGQAVDEPAENEVAGGSESFDEDAGDPTAGKRLKLEKDQATRQWLNAIRDEPARFLAARISQEMRRRKAAGTLPPPSADPW